ncbi:hypothetical protein [Methylobacterium gnaphalii]|uniref:Uncharacterized protein n=1 Tax=Methylobacterium gnaphalii TaxID=1010610 RepID=A0A512JPC3_9HYPH|nr:hypothetical protein [Methylobacterium gnaphalii]GEP11789.1 hypothetical protein MGN01_36340 [Methylobacterium gnaphalii]GJD69466.1 hypothetical protein MMMDOFMJ_2397 [Methylobacterium gnaphalii]GLS49576.1 hypothetical protein GCM10007885_24250 [Methylobacterium gnaphalii]
MRRLITIFQDILARDQAKAGHGIYIASKTVHAPRWRGVRAGGVPIISTWIDEAGAGETACFRDLWRRCVAEAARSGALIVYREPGEVLKGAFVEVGAALASQVPVFAVGCRDLSFGHHALVTHCDTIERAFNAAIGRAYLARCAEREAR